MEMSRPPSPRFVLVVVIVAAIVGLVPNKIFPVPDANKAVHKLIVIVFACCKDCYFASQQMIIYTYYWW